MSLEVKNNSKNNRITENLNTAIVILVVTTIIAGIFVSISLVNQGNERSERIKLQAEKQSISISKSEKEESSKIASSESAASVSSQIAENKAAEQSLAITLHSQAEAIGDETNSYTSNGTMIPSEVQGVWYYKVWTGRIHDESYQRLTITNNTITLDDLDSNLNVTSYGSQISISKGISRKGIFHDGGTVWNLNGAAYVGLVAGYSGEKELRYAASATDNDIANTFTLDNPSDFVQSP
ncbi:MAG: hypothetical protein LBM27_03870 [Lactobacillaceae bacterium]|jgi:hypothetical protein|nr:hypothetical protein [Lactobacillaceae bacterium]